MLPKTKLNFGTRKIQKSRYTYTVPLPPVWIRAMNMKKGDCVVFELTDDNGLRIFPADACQDTAGNSRPAMRGIYYE